MIYQNDIFCGSYHFYLSHCKAGLENVNLVICSNVSQSTFDHAKNMIEWMSDRVIQKFTQKREQPYEFKNAKAGYIFFLSLTFGSAEDPTLNQLYNHLKVMSNDIGSECYSRSKSCISHTR